jgi:hypothetical protein
MPLIILTRRFRILWRKRYDFDFQVVFEVIEKLMAPRKSHQKKSAFS